LGSVFIRLLRTDNSAISGAVFSCRLDNSIHGIFKRQPKSYNRSLVFDSTFANPIVYDEMTISTTTISDYGDCYEEVGGSYIFGLKYDISYVRILRSMSLSKCRPTLMFLRLHWDMKHFPFNFLYTVELQAEICQRRKLQHRRNFRSMHKLTYPNILFTCSSISQLGSVSIAG
uniref:ZP domain-containing protein n=1 Tax=Nippostrongylus brasiliensis TaxID=27835 RepID=A0A0N4YYN0_NIPBR